MLFNLEEDKGSLLKCYLIPDAGGTTPSIRMFSNGQQIALVSADTVRHEVIASGRHATGLVGFNIDEASIPGLSAYADLELREADTGLLIYRRLLPTFLKDCKIFRLETHLLPLGRFDDTFRDRMQVWHKGIDRFGLETTLQSLLLTNYAPYSSLFVSGRMQFQTIETNLRDFHSIVMLRDPFLELAERLLVLKNLPESHNDLLGERDLMTFKVVIDFLRDFDELDDRFCRQFVNRAPAPVLKVLSDPIVRQLSSNNPDDIPKKNALSAALQALSSFDVVGTRDEAEAFSQSVQDCLGLDHLPPLVHENKRVAELGHALRHLGRAEMLLEHDIEVFGHVKRAFAAAHQSPDHK